MPVQVGWACFATAADAGPAACAGFVPSTALSADGTKLRSSSCAGVDASGALQIRISTVDVATSAETVQNVAMQPSYPECTQQMYLDAALVLVGATLAALAPVWGVWKVRELIRKNNRVVE